MRSPVRGLLFIVALGGCNLVFGLDEPEDDGSGIDAGLDAPRTWAEAQVLFIPDAQRVAVLSGGARPGERRNPRATSGRIRSRSACRRRGRA